MTNETKKYDLNRLYFGRGIYMDCPNNDGNTNKEILEKYSKGLFALSCCARGEIPRRVIEGRIEEAEKAAVHLAQIFPDRFYLELQDHGLTHERLVNDTLLQISKQQREWANLWDE